MCDYDAIGCGKSRDTTVKTVEPREKRSKAKGKLANLI
jgi:NOL1/NOP2/fmu family ribosome biogenesis protein